MNNSMTLGKRISVGFAILVFITLVLGGIGVFNMRNAATNAEKLSEVYAPEVQLASDIFATSNHIRYDIRAFSMQDNETALANAKKGFIDLQKMLADAKTFGEKYTLKTLLEEQAKASKGLAEYMASTERSEKLLIRKKTLDKTMADNAELFMSSAADFLHSQEKTITREINERTEPQKILQRLDKMRMINDIIDMGNNARIGGQKAQVQRSIAMLEDTAKGFEGMYKTLGQIRNVTVLQADLDELKNVETAAKNYEASIRGFIVYMQEAATENTLRVKVAGDVLKAAETVMGIGLKNVKELSIESNDGLGLASLIMIIGLVSALLISIAVAFFIIRSIVKIVTESVKSLSEGTSQVVSASEQISSASVSLAEGASSQASSVEEVSATIEQATASNNQNAENSREANLLAQHSNDAAKVGNQRVGDLMIAMEKITDSSQKIAKIIKTIDEIAFQTNLLALNAAVEAARAGEHGLGFAVVAEEVKNLAERSAGAAKEITGIIEASIDQVKAGTEVANKTKESFTEILNGIKKTSDLIGEIAISAKEQAEGMNQIATAMGSVDQITQQNASASEETAAAAEELNAQALSMLDNVSELALLAGFDMGKENRGPTKSVKRISAPSIAPKRLGMSAKKPAMRASAPSASRRSNEDVFPLEESDLKEF